MITTSEDYCGIRYWREVFRDPNFVPRFHIWVYMGYDDEKQVHVFRSRSHNSFTWRRQDELKTPTFGPFLLNFKRISERLEEIDRKRQS